MSSSTSKKRPQGRAVVVLAGMLAVSLVAIGVLSWKLWTVRQSAIQRRAWKSCRKLSMQHLLFQRAAARAKAEGRKLVVIGNPRGGWVNKVVPVYGCGDICIDLNGCSGCAKGTKVLRMDAIKALRGLPADSAVVFESETLEYVDDMTAAVEQLNRITGGDYSRIFSVHTISIPAWRYHTRGVRPPTPTAKIKRARRQGRRKYELYGEGKARRIIYRFPPRDPYRWVEL